MLEHVETSIAVSLGLEVVFGAQLADLLKNIFQAACSHALRVQFVALLFWSCYVPGAVWK